MHACTHTSTHEGITQSNMNGKLIFNMPAQKNHTHCKYLSTTNKISFQLFGGSGGEMGKYLTTYTFLSIILPGALVLLLHQRVPLRDKADSDERAHGNRHARPQMRSHPHTRATLSPSCCAGTCRTQAGKDSTVRVRVLGVEPIFIIQLIRQARDTKTSRVGKWMGTADREGGRALVHSAILTSYGAPDNSTIH